jgi:hypothetical protein
MANAFNLNDFTQNPTLEALDPLKKDSLLEIARHYGLAVGQPDQKGTIKQVIIDYLIAQKLVDKPERYDNGGGAGGGDDKIRL